MQLPFVLGKLVFADDVGILRAPVVGMVSGIPQVFEVARMARLDHLPPLELVGFDDAGLVALADEMVEIPDTEAALAPPAERHGSACGIVLAAHHRNAVRVLFSQHDCFHGLMSFLSVIIRFCFDR